LDGRGKKVLQKIKKGSEKNINAYKKRKKDMEGGRKQRISTLGDTRFKKNKCQVAGTILPDRILYSQKKNREKGGRKR